MKRFGFVVVALVIAGSARTQAAFSMITPSDFATGAQVITFESPTTALPTVPGVTFLDLGTPGEPDWYFGTVAGNGILGNDDWTNIVHTLGGNTYSDLGLDFATPVQAIGGFVGWIPNFTNQNPSQVVVELLVVS